MSCTVYQYSTGGLHFSAFITTLLTATYVTGVKSSTTKSKSSTLTLTASAAAKRIYHMENIQSKGIGMELVYFLQPNPHSGQGVEPGLNIERTGVEVTSSL